MTIATLLAKQEFSITAREQIGDVFDNEQDIVGHRREPTKRPAGYQT